MNSLIRTLFFMLVVGPIILIVWFGIKLSDPKTLLMDFFSQPLWLIAMALTIGIGGFLNTIK